jgi:hypothetical protein
MSPRRFTVNNVVNKSGTAGKVGVHNRKSIKAQQEMSEEFKRLQQRDAGDSDVTPARGSRRKSRKSKRSRKSRKSRKTRKNRK